MGDKKKDNQFLVVKGIDGLGNRLMCLADAIDYCRKTNRILYVDWADGMFSEKGENAFPKVFIIKNLPCVYSKKEVTGKTYYPEYTKYLPIDFKTRDYFMSYHYRDSNFFVRKIIDLGSSFVHKFGSENMFKRYQILWYHRCAKDKSVRKRLKCPWGDIATFGSNLPSDRKEDIIFYMDFAPGYESDTIRNHIGLNPEFEEKIKDYSIKHDLTNGTVGVHIRDTDKQNVGKYEEFIEYLKKFMKEHNADQVYLATDQQTVLDTFNKAFGDNLLVYPKYMPQIESGSQLGMHTWAEQSGESDLCVRMFQESAMDMWLLSKTEYLFYQGNSTFSMISRDIKNDDKCFDWQKMICQTGET